jgi:RimJ/RimL family protein N-acetyltransferase
MSGVVFLRALRSSDFAFAALWKNDPDIRDFTASYFFPTTEADEQVWIQKNSNAQQNTKVVFAIALPDHPDPIGFIHLNEIHWIHRTAMLGIMIGSKEHQGKGHGAQAMKQLIAYGFSVLNLRKISLQVVSFNTAAIHLYEKLGFQREGILRKQYFLRGAYHDGFLYALMNPAPEASIVG